MVFIHELGHYYAAKVEGFETNGIYFLPFLGGVCSISRKEGDEIDEGKDFFVYISGPMFGITVGVIFLLLFLYFGILAFGAFALAIFLINLFNLFPIYPLDGGGLLKSISFSFGDRIGIFSLAIGLVLCLVLIISGFNPAIMILLGLVNISYIMQNTNNLKRTRMSKSNCVRSLFLYAGLVFITFLLLGFTLDRVNSKFGKNSENVWFYKNTKVVQYK